MNIFDYLLLGFAAVTITSASGCLEQKVDDPPRLNSDAKGRVVSGDGLEPVVKEEDLSLTELEELLGIPPMGKVIVVSAPSDPLVPSVYPPTFSSPLPSEHYSPRFGFSPVFNSESLLGGLQLQGDYPLDKYVFFSVEVESVAFDKGIVSIYSDEFIIPKNATGFYEISQFLPYCVQCSDSLDLSNHNIKFNFGLFGDSLEINLSPESLDKIMDLRYETSSILPEPCDF
jgi:hypothetical protein